MKNLRQSLMRSLVALGLCASASATFAQTPIWSEEFNGDRIDHNVWSYTTGGSGNGNGELQYYTADSSNAYVEGGNLVIQAKREAMSGKQFTSSRLHTNGRMAFKYGTLEARIKLPNLANGLWPAFWMMGTNFGIDGWPRCGEWDILEAGFKAAQQDGTINRNISSAMHWWYEAGTWGSWLQADSAANLVMSPDANFNFYDDYHLYKMDWTPSAVTMYVDGAQIFTMAITDPNMSEFRDNPAFITLNLAVGGSNFVEITDPNLITAPLPAKMYVDYVRLFGNANTELFLPGNPANLPTGNFGVMTETTPTLNELNWGDRTNLYIWNNMNPIATVPSEGSSALSYRVNTGNWWGMGLLHKDYNMRNYTHGYLHLDIKTTSPTNLEIHVASTSGGSGTVVLAPGGDQYGLVRDGDWHSVAIPLSKFGNVDYETVKTFFSISGPAPAATMDIAFDNIYYSESIALIAPEQGSFGIYTEDASHKTAGELSFGVNGDLFIWENTLTLQPGEVLEGSSSLNLKSNNRGWYGMGLTAREGFNLTAFDNASAALHFSMKTTDQAAFKIGFKSGNVDDIGQKWINFTVGSDPYGFARDGAWHEIVIPMSELAKTLDLFDVRQLLEVLSISGEISSLAIDDVYISGGLLAQSSGNHGAVVNRAPTAAIVPSVMGGAGPLWVNFDASKSNDANGDALTYSWDFGDGATATGVNVDHTFANDGSYNVVLSVSDGQLTTTAKTIIFVDSNFGLVKSKKRGVGYGSHSPADMAIMSKGISWWYNWGITPDLAIKDTYQSYGVEYVPMTWNGGFDEPALRAYISSHPDVKYLLAFNEPQFHDQANMTPTEVAAQWPRIESIANDYGLKIVSVALNFCGNCVTDPQGNPYYVPWTFLDDFLAICPTCRIDAVSIHAYMPDVNGIQWYVNQFKRFGKPIWLTEFCAWEANTTIESQQRMLTQVVDYLENESSIERYSWFMGRSNGHPYNSLLDYRQSGVVTELGDIYLNMPVHGDSSNVHTLPKLIEAERYAKQNAPRTEATYSHTYGIRLEQTQDSTGFLNLAGAVAGDWIEYNVVSQAETYNIGLRVASEAAGTIDVLVDGAPAATINVPATGALQAWATANAPIDLTAGAHKLRLVFNQTTNVNWLNITEGALPPSSSSAASVSVASSSSRSSVVPGSSSRSSSSAQISSIANSAIASSAITSSAATSSAVASSVVATSSSSSSSSIGPLIPLSGVIATASTDPQPAHNAIDRNAGSRWESAQGVDPTWIALDLGTQYDLNQVSIDWEAANAKVYTLEGSNDGTTWTVLASYTGGTFGSRTDNLSVSGTYRYVRMYGTERTSPYGYSIFEFRLYGTPVGPAAPSLISSWATATASTEPGPANNAIDGNPGTRWESIQGAAADPTWIQLDFGGNFDLSSVVIDWEAANAASYTIECSLDGTSWSTLSSFTGGAFGNRTDTSTVTGTCRYMRVYATQRSSPWGYSIFELKVYGFPAAASSSSSSVASSVVASSSVASSVASSAASSAEPSSVSSVASSSSSDSSSVASSVAPSSVASSSVSSAAPSSVASSAVSSVSSASSVVSSVASSVASSAVSSSVASSAVSSVVSSAVSSAVSSSAVSSVASSASSVASSAVSSVASSAAPSSVAASSVASSASSVVSSTASSVASSAGSSAVPSSVASSAVSSSRSSAVSSVAVSSAALSSVASSAINSGVSSAAPSSAASSAVSSVVASASSSSAANAGGDVAPTSSAASVASSSSSVAVSSTASSTPEVVVSGSNPPSKKTSAGVINWVDLLLLAVLLGSFGLRRKAIH